MQPEHHHYHIFEHKFSDISPIRITYGLPVILGVKPHERCMVQDIVISLTAWPLKNYNTILFNSQVKKIIFDYTQIERPYLIEHMSYELGEKIMNYFLISKLMLTIKKPTALRDAQHAYVSIYMEK
jgi:dihydroneopterin aldolase